MRNGQAGAQNDKDSQADDLAFDIHQERQVTAARYWADASRSPRMRADVCCAIEGGLMAGQLGKQLLARVDAHLLIDSLDMGSYRQERAAGPLGYVRDGQPVHQA